jgi:hypothetical protein
MTEPEQTPDVEQRLARELDPERHRAPSEGVPQGLPDDTDATDADADADVTEADADAEAGAEAEAEAEDGRPT